jgi:hypothetical protein
VPDRAPRYAAAVRIADRRPLALALALAALPLVGAYSGAGARPPGAAPSAHTTRQVVVVRSLADGAQYASIVNRQKRTLDRVDGTLPADGGQAHVAGLFAGSDLRLIEEDANHGEQGSFRHRYYVSDGRLVYYHALVVQARDVGEGLRPAHDEITLALAYDGSGRRVGAEKVVDRESVPLASGDEKQVLARFQALSQALAGATAQ